MKDKLGEEEIVMYAWIGEDELGSGVVGIKQGVTPAGVIPLAAMGYHLDRLSKLQDQMEEMARIYGKKRYLVRFISVEIVGEAG